MITPKDFDNLAQKAHVLGGALAVLGPAGLCSHPFHLFAACIGTFSIMSFAAIKEFWYDENYEPVDIRGSNTRDFMFYAVGAGSALVLCIVSWWIFG